MNARDTSGRARIILLAGFLGAGKTTLLRNLLAMSDMSGTVVIVNEFGEIGIDGLILRKIDNEIVELRSGCICCTLSLDLKKTLLRVTEFAPRYIFIEASGVADPKPIALLLQEPDLRERVLLDRIVTVLDADCWEAHEIFGTLFYSQLEMADLILLNKADTRGREEIARYLDEMHGLFPGSQIVPTVHCAVDREAIWSSVDPDRSLRLQAETEDASSYHNPNDHEAGSYGFISFSYREERLLDDECFRKFIDGMPWELFRVKGTVRMQKGTVLVNSVGGKTEWTDWESDNVTCLSFIGWDIDSEALLEELKKCVIE